MVVLAAIYLAVKRHDLDWRRPLRISLLVFLGWNRLWIFWSGCQ